MDEIAKELEIAARFLKYDRPPADKPSGAARKRAHLMRGRTKDKHGVWCLNLWQPHEKVARGRVRS